MGCYIGLTLGWLHARQAHSQLCYLSAHAPFFLWSNSSPNGYSVPLEGWDPIQYGEPLDHWIMIRLLIFWEAHSTSPSTTVPGDK